MAKETKDGKIQFVFVNVEGDQQTLQEALRQVGTVLNRGMNTQPKTLIAIPVADQKSLPDGSENGDRNKFYEVREEHAEINQTEEASVTSNSKAKPAKKTPKVPDLLPDDDLISDEVPFRDFANQKNPSTHFDRYLVIAAWFKRHKNVDEITIRHVYSCYKLMNNWSAPDDLSVAFRDMKRLHGYFSKGKSPSSWVLTLVGSNKVDDMNRPAATE